MALRQTTGFVESLLRLLSLDWAVPDFSTSEAPEVNIPCRGSDAPLELLIDSTGIRVEGKGEWNVRKHGGTKSGARSASGSTRWRRIGRRSSGPFPRRRLEIRAAEFTTSDMGDAPMLPELLVQIPPDREVTSVTADGAFGHRFDGGPERYHRRSRAETRMRLASCCWAGASRGFRRRRSGRGRAGFGP